MIVARLCWSCGGDLEVIHSVVQHENPCAAFLAAVAETTELIRAGYVTWIPLREFVARCPRTSVLVRRAVELAARHQQHGGAS
ncbi:MAG TPA: hypothetical protein VGF94_08035 [Kofleriaceae bacterium]